MKTKGKYAGAWLATMAVLLEEGQATAHRITALAGGYSKGSISSALCHMLPTGFVQHCGASQWGLTKAGIEAALQAEREAIEEYAEHIGAMNRQAGETA